MDFKALLDQEILAKKASLPKSSSSTSRYSTRGEVEKQKLVEGLAEETQAPENVPAGGKRGSDEVSERADKNCMHLSTDHTSRYIDGEGLPGERTDSRSKKLKTENDVVQSVSQVTSAMLLEPLDSAMLKKDAEKARGIIHQFFKALVKEWGVHLETQKDDDKMPGQLRMNLALYKQSKESLHTFFKLLKKNELQADIMGKIGKICQHMQAREYVNANDAYLRLAIGNAPWPIGVTAVGIHERSAHDRISSSQTAHALNDEVTRKWLQAIKRLITFCQTKYPPASRSQLMG